MKKRNILFATLAAAVGIGVFTGFNNNYYQEANEESRAELTSIKENADEVTREFIEKLEAQERPSRVEYWQVRSEDGAVDYIRVSGYDQENSIDISGRLRDNIVDLYLSKGDDRTWIDTERNLYHQDKRSDHNISRIVTTNELSFGEESALSALGNGRIVEKTDFGYKVIISDELNYGYSLYDENANLFETYLDNSQGKVTSKLVGTDEDVVGIYDKYLAMTANMSYTDNIADIKEAAN